MTASHPANPLRRRYVLHLSLGFLGYAAGLVAMNLLYRPEASWRWVLVALPVLPLLYTATVVIRSVALFDEMWRKVHTEAMAFSGVATGFTCFAWLFIRDMGAPEFRGEWAFYLMWMYYGLGSFIFSRRHA